MASYMRREDASVIQAVFEAGLEAVLEALLETG
jgi:hypothetical protein